MTDDLEKRLRELIDGIAPDRSEWIVLLARRAARIGAEIEREEANKLYEDAMNAIHERMGVKRDGLASAFAWIDEHKEAVRDAINHARDRHDY